MLLRDKILQAATDLFLHEGYGSTSIEAVAARAGISKRTFYDRFDDKAALFTAVVHRIIEQIRPRADVPLIVGSTLPEILTRIAGLLLRASLAPSAIALHRLVTAESVRFPELMAAVERDGSKREAVELIGGLLAREPRTATLAAAQREFAAEQFIYMVITVPQRRAMGYGRPLKPGEMESWINDAVTLFLDGCRGFGR